MALGWSKPSNSCPTPSPTGKRSLLQSRLAALVVFMSWVVEAQQTGNPCHERPLYDGHFSNPIVPSWPARVIRGRYGWASPRLDPLLTFVTGRSGGPVEQTPRLAVAPKTTTFSRHSVLRFSWWRRIAVGSLSHGGSSNT